MADACIGRHCASDVVEGVKDGVDKVVGGASDVVEGAKDAVDSASSFAQLWTDPFGNTYKALQEGAHSLATDVLPALTHATMPDLTQEWWVSAYAVSFALAVFLMAFLMFPGLVSAARGRTSGQDLFEMFTLYVPLFLAGAIFGPPLGIFLVKFFGAITDSVATWGIVSSADEVTEQMTRMLEDGDATGLAGGTVVGILMMLLMLLGLLLVVLMLVVQLVTLYFTGILFPLGWVWIVHKPTRGFGYKIMFVWLGVLASHPLMFLLLGLAYSMIAAQVTVFEGVPSLQRLVTLVVSILALLVAGTAPFTLYKLAPVMPFGSNADGPSTGGSSSNVGDNDLSQTTRRNRGDSSDAGAEDARTSPSTRGEGGGGGGTAPSSGPSVGGGTSATGAGSTSEATAGAQQGPAEVGATSTAPAGAGAGSSAGAGAAAEGAGAGAAGGGAGAAAGATTAAEAGAGAAVGATGVGTVIVAAAVVAKAGYDYTRDTSQQAVEMTAGDVESFGGDNVMEGR